MYGTLMIFIYLSLLNIMLYRLDLFCSYPPNYGKYIAVSRQFREIVAEYDPYYVTLGLDEVNMDVTDYLQRNNIDNEEGK